MAAPTEEFEIVPPNAAEELRVSLSEFFAKYGFECHPFKISWYNEKVEPTFHLPYQGDVLSFCIISTPQMFDKAFKPFIQDKKTVGVRDPIDECVAFHFQKAKQEFSKYQIDTIQDYELHPNRRPKILVQTAGHVSGAAYYYQRADLQQDPWPENKRIYGISMHPKYGGWFAFRGAFIFKTLRCPDLPQPDTPKLLTTDDAIKDLLDKLNNNWKDNTFRDAITPIERYSEEQIKYFDTLPKDRAKLLGLEKEDEDKLKLDDSRDMGH